MMAFGADMYQAVKCLQVLFKSIDAKSLAKFRPEFVRTSMLLFFNNCADDLSATLVNLNEGKLSHLRGTHMKTCTSLRYIFEIQGERPWSSTDCRLLATWEQNFLGTYVIISPRGKT